MAGSNFLLVPRRSLFVTPNQEKASFADKNRCFVSFASSNRRGKWRLHKVTSLLLLLRLFSLAGFPRQNLLNYISIKKKRPSERRQKKWFDWNFFSEERRKHFNSNLVRQHNMFCGRELIDILIGFKTEFKGICAAFCEFQLVKQSKTNMRALKFWTFSEIIKTLKKLDLAFNIHYWDQILMLTW